MTSPLQARASKPDDRYPHSGQTVQRVARAQLSVVRVAAVAWRNGLSALLAGLLGFSLIKGRSEVGTLAAPWRIVVGGLLLVALLVGTYGALRLLRAAHGRPRRTSVKQESSRLITDHAETAESLAAFDRGVAATLGCAALLVAAVAVTWYGPAAAKPKLEVTIDGEAVCGSVIRTDGGRLTLRTSAGERLLSLTRATGFRPVDACAG